MRIVVDNHDATEMKCLGDFDRILNLFADLNKDFPYSNIIQMRYTDNRVVVSACNHTDMMSKPAFEKHINTIWGLCFSRRDIFFDYGDGYSSIRQVANGC